MNSPQYGKLDPAASRTEASPSLPWAEMGSLTTGSGSGSGYASSLSYSEQTPPEPVPPVTLQPSPVLDPSPFATPAPGAMSPQGVFTPAKAASKRRPGRALIVWGLITAFILAPLSMLAYVTVAADLFSLSSRLAPVSSGSVVHVDETGGYFLMAVGSGTADACVLKPATGKALPLEVLPGASPSWWAQNIPTGDYTLECSVNGDPMLVGATNVLPANITRHARVSFLVSTAVGLTGITLTVMGLRRRSRIE